MRVESSGIRTKDFLAYILRKMRWYRYFKFVQNYLVPKNYRNMRPSDENGIAPWFTYPAIKFLNSILNENYRIFEYGSGSSTLYFHDYCKEVVSIEHDKSWFDKIKHSQDEGLTVILSERTTGTESENASIYLEFISDPTFSEEFIDEEVYVKHGLVNRGYIEYACQLIEFPKGYFDVIVIDGMARNFCGYLAAKYVSEKGFLILDNSDRWQYNALLDYLHQWGFARIDFWGPGPINTIEWCTSIFFKNSQVFKQSSLRDLNSGDLIKLKQKKPFLS